MKKILGLLFMAVCVFGLLGCGGKSASADVQPLPASTSRGSGKKILITYFSLPESNDANNMSSEGRNSAVVMEGKVVGNTEYVARLIQSKVGGDIFRIEPAKPYDISNHSALTKFARNEKNNNARPALAKELPNLDKYDIVFVGYPIWWGDLPMIMYTFLEKYDFAGKKIIPFNTHGGSGLSGTVDTIINLQPNSAVEKDAFTIYRRDIKNADQEVPAWLEKIGF